MRERRLQGQKDIPLNVTGREQARRTASTLAEILGESRRSPSISSQARSGARARRWRSCAPPWDSPPQDYRTDERLVEVSFGDWEGFTIEELKATQRERVRRTQRSTMGFHPARRRCGKLRNPLLADRLLAEFARASDRLRHAWRRHPHAFQDDRAICRSTRLPRAKSRRTVS